MPRIQRHATLDELVDRCAVAAPESVALIWQDAPITFATLAGRIRRAASAVTASTAPGDRVAICSWNRPEVLELLYGIPAAGRIAVPLNARLHPAELRAQLDRVDARLVIGEACAPRRPGDRTPGRRAGRVVRVVVR